MICSKKEGLLLHYMSLHIILATKASKLKEKKIKQVVGKPLDFSLNMLFCLIHLLCLLFFKILSSIMVMQCFTRFLKLCNWTHFLSFHFQAFAQLLQAPQDDAKMIIKDRFPVPRLVICDQHGSQVCNHFLSFATLYQLKYLQIV